MLYSDYARPTAKGINVTIDITDQKGIDITSLVQVKVYQESQGDTDNGLTDRQLTTRLINKCVNSTENFLRSKCTPLNGKLGSLQSWVIICQREAYQYAPHTSQIIGTTATTGRYSGRCEDDEICVNRFGSGAASVSGYQIAMCVKKSTFDSTMYGSGRSDSQQAIDQVLNNNANGMYALSSDSDGSTAMEVNTFDIDTWIDGILADTKEGAVRSKKCTHCTELNSSPFAPETNALRVEASLMTAGTAAATAVVWLAVFSG